MNEANDLVYTEAEFSDPSTLTQINTQKLILIQNAWPLAQAYY